jgi:spermidine/putrescine-binding protein
MANVPNFTKYVQDKYQREKVDIGPGKHHLADAPGVFLVVYAKDKFPTPPPETYEVFHDPKYEGKFALRDYAIYQIMMNAAYLGYDLENLSLTKEQEDKLFDTIKKQRALVKTYWKSAAENRTLLANREVWASDYWISRLGSAGPAQPRVVSSKGRIADVDPGLGDSEGVEIARSAEQLLNYYYEPEVFMRYKRAIGSDVVILKDDAL